MPSVLLDKDPPCTCVCTPIDLLAEQNALDKISTVRTKLLSLAQLLRQRQGTVQDLRGQVQTLSQKCRQQEETNQVLRLRNEQLREAKRQQRVLQGQLVRLESDNRRLSYRKLEDEEFTQPRVSVKSIEDGEEQAWRLKLSEELSRSRREVDEHKSRADELGKTVTRLEEKLRRLESEKEQLQLEKDEAAQRANTFQLQLEQLRKNNLQLAEYARQADRTKTQLQRKVESVNLRNSILEQTSQELRLRLQDRQSQLEEARKEQQRVRAEREKEEATLRRLLRMEMRLRQLQERRSKEWEGLSALWNQLEQEARQACVNEVRNPPA